MLDEMTGVCFVVFFFFLVTCAACRILVPRLVIEPIHLAVEAQT